MGGIESVDRQRTSTGCVLHDQHGWEVTSYTALLSGESGVCEIIGEISLSMR